MPFAEESANPENPGVLGHGGLLLSQDETAARTGEREEAGISWSLIAAGYHGQAGPARGERRGDVARGIRTVGDSAR